MDMKKKEEKLFDAITNLPDKIIEEAKDRAGKKRKIQIGLVSVAAGVLLVFGIVYGVGRVFYSGSSIAEEMEIKFPKAYAFDDYETRDLIKEANPVSDEFYQSIKEFTWKTTSEFVADQKSNVNYSPLSLYYALALATIGANGETEKELLTLLCVEDSGQLSAQCNNLYHQLYADNEIGKLKIANSLWLSREATFKQPFIKNAANKFYAPVYRVDFKEPETGKAMGEWIAKNTNGTLTPKMETDVNQIMSILNTVYFKNEWINRFDSSKTKKDIFYLSDGSTIECDFMNQSYGSAGFTKGNGFISSSLSLKYFAHMVFILPDEGVTPQELLASPEKVKEVFETEQNSYGEVTWQVPKFSFSSQFDLAEGLKNLGVKKAFEADADFSRITDETAFISNIHQETHIGIDEKGVEASAFTEIQYSGAGMPKDKAEMILNRPFIYGIVSNNGTLLFVGICENPVE